MRGETVGCAGKVREAFGPVGAAMSGKRPLCCVAGDGGWFPCGGRLLAAFGDGGTGGCCRLCDPEGSPEPGAADGSLAWLLSQDLEV